MQMKKKTLSILLSAILVILHLNGLVVYARDEDFNDVPSEYWAYDTIMELSDKGIIDGFDDNTFNPNGEITREQFIKLLVCATDNVEENASTDNIEDIGSEEWSYNYLANADECSIIGNEDYSNGFNAHGLLDRKTAVKWISKSINVSNNNVPTGIFKDITDDDTDFYASELNGYGIINGYEDGSFRPDNVLTRAEAATIIKNITDYLESWEMSDDEKDLVDYADGVLKLDSERKSNILTKNTDMTCELSNINNEIKSLKKGDILVIPNCEKAPGGMAVKVKSIIIKNQTATIVKDNNLSLEDVVDKIDINKKSALSTENIIKDNLPDGVVITDNSSYAMTNTNKFNYNTLTASLNDNKMFFDNKSKTGGFKVTFTKEIQPQKGISIIGSIDIDGTIHADMKYDGKIIKQPNFSADLDINASPELTVKASGETEDLTILEIPFKVPFEVGNIFLTIALKVNASGEVYVTASCDIHHSGSLQYRPSQGIKIPTYKSNEFRVTPDVELEVSATVTPKIVFRTGISFLGLNEDKSLFSVFVDPEIGLHIKAALNSKSQNHIHQPCIAIILTPYVAVSAGMEFIGKDKENWDDIWSYDFNDYNCYAGLADKWEFGKGICPYLKEPEINTYKTRYGEINMVTCPQFTFDYSDDWKITREEVNKYGKPIYEWVTLTNKNNDNIEINYISHSDLGGGGKFITAYEISKAADSQFIPGYAGGEDGDYSVLGNFMVGEIKAIGEYDRKTGELNYFDGGISYAVMPESYIGIHDATGMSGYQEMLSFPYAFEILFYATSKGGYFTDEEKQEVLKVLSTFKAVE